MGPGEHRCPSLFPTLSGKGDDGVPNTVSHYGVTSVQGTQGYYKRREQIGCWLGTVALSVVTATMVMVMVMMIVIVVM